ncbi:MAG UNVERIFIED_CONTAM: hypothetical protein LVT10_17470, partial [Anaerolineae bacterium]
MFAGKIGADYINHLPSSMTTLYALSEILWEQGDATDDPRRDLFAKAAIRKICGYSSFSYVLL